MKKSTVLVGVLVVLLAVTGFVVYKSVSGPKVPQAAVEDQQKPDEAQVDASVSVLVVKSPIKAYTVVLKVSGLGNTYSTVAYELTYESQGLIKGVNSGSKPIDVTGKDAFEREVYMGTCSKNDCKPDVGVKKVSINLEFIDSSGKKSQFSKDYDL